MTRFSILALAALTLTACDSGEPDDDDGGGEQELITEVTLTLTPEDGGDAIVISALDTDGDGRDIVYSPTSAALRAGQSYAGTITLRDGVNDEDITAEVREEAEEHLFRYTLDPSALGAAVPSDQESDYADENTNGGDYAVGLRFDVDVRGGAPDAGVLGVVLYHFDDAPKTSSTATSDEIDIDLAFPVTVSGPAL